MNFQNLGIATRLWLAVGVIIVALLTLVGWAALRSARMQAETETTMAVLDGQVSAANRWSACAAVGSAADRRQQGRAGEGTIAGGGQIKWVCQALVRSRPRQSRANPQGVG